MLLMPGMRSRLWRGRCVMSRDQVYELNDLLAAFMDRHGMTYDDDRLNEAVWATVAAIESED